MSGDIKLRDGTPEQRMEVMRALGERGWDKSEAALAFALRFVVEAEGPEAQKRRMDILRASIPYFFRSGSFEETMRRAYRMADYVENGGAP